MYEARSVPTRGLPSAEPFAGLAPRLRTLAAAAVARIREEVALRWRIHRDRRHLQQLDDRMLEDVGLSRHELRLRLNGSEPVNDWR